MINKRDFPRVSLFSDVDYSSTMIARARNVSESGVGILSRRHFIPGTPLFLIISLPESEFFKVIGQVVWNKELKTDLYTNGVKFLSLKNKDKTKIHNYVQQVLNGKHDLRENTGTVIDILIDFQIKGRAYAKNLKPDGIYIVTSKVLEKGKVMFINISLPFNQTINIYGRVIWSRNLRLNVYETEIEFLDMKQEDLDILKDFIKIENAQAEKQITL